MANTLTAAIGLCLSTQGASSPPGRVPACRPSKALRVGTRSVEVFVTHQSERNPKPNTKSNSPAVRGETEFLDLELEWESLLPVLSLAFTLRRVFLGLCVALGGGREWEEVREGGGPLLPWQLLLSNDWLLLLRAEDIQADSVYGKSK